MGLDMYAFKVTKPEEPSPIHLIIEADYEPFDRNNVEQIFYWRKHYNLQDWMAQLYYRKGGLSESFNLATVVLTAYDLDDLEKNINTGFFGDAEEIKSTDLEFVEKARKELEQGNVVYYTSWW